MMIRLLFLPFFAILMFSCESESKEVDPWFYQISTADSVRCMNEILSDIREEAMVQQRFQYEFSDNSIPFCGVRYNLNIYINRKGNVMIEHDDTSNVTERVVDYFMFNRNLSQKEIESAYLNPDHPGFNFPFYYEFDFEEINEKIEETQSEWEEVRQIEGVDPILVEYYASKVDEWKKKLRTLELTGDATLKQISFQATVGVDYGEKIEKCEEVLNDVALAFYYMRNYECMRYFNETYLNLYDRAQKKSRKLDLEKLIVLEALHPAAMYDNDRKIFPPNMIPPPEPLN